MATSQNGYRANDRALVSTRTIPGTTVRVAVRNGAAGDLLLAVAGRFDREVEDIDGGQVDDWGYAERKIRGSSTTLSNHASGTAVDLNAPRHPLGKRGTFSPAQVGAIHRILAAAGGCIRWGGDYRGRADEMHLEVVASEAACARALGAFGGATTNPAQPGHPGAVLATGGVLARGSKGPAVKRLQEVLNDWYPDLHLVEDGDYGLATERGVRRLQTAARLSIDGAAGPQVLGYLHLA